MIMFSGWTVMETPVTGREKGQSDQAPWNEKVATEKPQETRENHFNGVRKVETRQKRSRRDLRSQRNECTKLCRSLPKTESREAPEN